MFPKQLRTDKQLHPIV